MRKLIFYYFFHSHPEIGNLRVWQPPWGRPCQTPCCHAQGSGCLYTSFDQDHDSVFFSLFEHQTSHAAYFNARGLLYECVFDTLLFYSSYQPCLETRFSSRHYSTYFFFFFLFWIIIPAILPATMLGYYSMSASSMPFEYFHRRFDLLEVCFL
jgi:hypothetical protein